MDEQPIIQIYSNGLKIYCKKKDMKKVYETLKGGGKDEGDN